MKKRGMSLITKILLMVPILSSFILGINGVLLGITQLDFLARIVKGPIIFPIYIIIGIFTVIISVFFAIKTIKE
jgi:hypothetical protein